MTDNIFVFDKSIVRQKRNRCAPHLNEHGFLFDWALNQATERLEVIKKEFPLALKIGNRTKNITSPKHKIEKTISIDSAENLSPNIIADEELLPFKKNSFDLISSILSLHTCNDLPGTLIQINNCLKADGFFIGALFGGETLYELRQAIHAIETKQTGGVSPRVSPFADLPQASALMQRAGFNLPVIDSEKITVTYDSIFNLMKDLRLMGESNSIIERKKTFTSRYFFQELDAFYKENFSEPNGKIKATFEIIFLSGWKFHESQQKPLKPGSAKNRLSDALETKEGKLPC